MIFFFQQFFFPIISNFLLFVSFTFLILVYYVSLHTIATGIPYPAEPRCCFSLRLSLTCHFTLLFAVSLIGVTVVADGEWFPESEQSCLG